MSASSPPVIRESLTICNEKGLHARAAVKFVHCAKQWGARITVEKDGVAVEADSIMGLMLLAAAKGTAIQVTAEGEDAEEAVAALGRLVADRFEEPR